MDWQTGTAFLHKYLPLCPTCKSEMNCSSVCDAQKNALITSQSQCKYSNTMKIRFWLIVLAIRKRNKGKQRAPLLWMFTVPYKCISFFFFTRIEKQSLYPEVPSWSDDGGAGKHYSEDPHASFTTASSNKCLLLVESLHSLEDVRADTANGRNLIINDWLKTLAKE